MSEQVVQTEELFQEKSLKKSDDIILALLLRKGFSIIFFIEAISIQILPFELVVDTFEALLFHWIGLVNHNQF